MRETVIMGPSLQMIWAYRKVQTSGEKIGHKYIKLRQLRPPHTLVTLQIHGHACVVNLVNQ